MHEALFSSTSKSLITLDLGYILGYVQRITTSSRSARIYAVISVSMKSAGRRNAI